MNKFYTILNSTKNILAQTGKVLAFSIISLSLPVAANAQVTINEFFDTGVTLPNLPAGWSQSKIIGSGAGNDFTSVTAGTFPTCTTFSSPNMIKYNAYNADNGDQAFMTSVPYDFAGRGASIPTVSFRIFRDDVRTGSEELEVYINTQPNLSGATLIGSVRRNRTQSTAFTGTEPANNWYQYTYNVPAGAPFSTSINYVIFKCTTSASASKGNIFIDNVSVVTYPVAMTIISATTVQNTAPVGLGSTNQDIIRMEVHVEGAASPLSMSSITINTGGTSSLADISNARIFYTGLSNVFSTTAFPQFGPTTPPTGNFVVAGARPLVNGTNYFWLTYDITSALGSVGNVVDADWVEFTAGTVYTPSPQAPLGARPIAANYCQPTYTWGTSWPGDYIARVFLPGINGIINNTTLYAPHPPDYTFYPPGPGLTTTLVQGATYPLSTTVGTYTSSNNIMAWIDFNRNGVFEVAERVYEIWWSSPNAYVGGNVTRVANFTVPNLGASSIYLGQTRMRVREIWLNRTPTPPNTTGAFYVASLVSDPYSCDNYGYGETEDYIVTIQPDCVPGTWLGFTKDWNTASNWCGGIPDNTVDVRIPQFPIGTFMPTIYANTPAVTRDLTVDTAATLTIEAPNNASLTVHGNLLIRMPTSKLEVVSNFTKNGTIGSGKDFTNSGGNVPMRGSRPGHRIQMLYKDSELSARGFAAGDQISQLGFQIIGTGNLSAVDMKKINATISNTAANDVGAFSPVGPWLATGAGPAITIPYPTYTPVCPPPGCPVIRATGYVDASVDNMFVLATPFTYTGGNILVDVCFDNGAIGTNYVPYSTRTTGFSSVIWGTLSTIGGDGCNITHLPSPTTAGGGYTWHSAGVTDYRPNLVLVATTPSVTFPIGLMGNFTNNGTFTAGNSEVKFIGATLQTMNGNPTTFNRIFIENTGTNQYIRMNMNITTAVINRSATASRGILDLNGYRLIVTDGGNRDLAQTTAGINNMTPNNIGWIRAETKSPQPISWLQWNLGSLGYAGTGSLSGVVGTVRARVFPFISSTNVNLHVELGHPNFGIADVGNVSMSTYATTPNNLPLPPGVIHVSGPPSIVDNSANAVDRFWLVDRGGAYNNGSLRVRWLPAEDWTALPLATTLNAKVQQWQNVGWMAPLTTTAVIATPRTASFPANFNNWNLGGTTVFTVANNSQPLPIELLSFDARLVDKKVDLKWATGSEKENSHFTIERTRDGENFQYVTKVDGAGNSSTVKEYYTIDPSPLKGLSYYRLGQTDLDGTTAHSELVAITNTGAEFDIAILTNTEGVLQLGFTYDSHEALRLVIVDALGRQVYTKNYQEVEPGYNSISADLGNLSPGVYFISLANSQKSVSRKMVN